MNPNKNWEGPEPNFFGVWSVGSKPVGRKSEKERAKILPQGPKTVMRQKNIAFIMIC